MRKFDSKAFAREYNSLRGLFFSMQELKDKTPTAPKSTLFWTEFLKANILVVIKKGYYTTRDNPIHYKVFQKVYDSYLKRVNSYYSQSKKGALENALKEAIALLNDNGYVVFKKSSRL